MPEINYEQATVIKDMAEIIPDLRHSKQTSYTRTVLNSRGEVASRTTISREEWIMDWLEYFEDQIAQHFDLEKLEGD